MAWPSASARTKNWGTEVLTDGDLEAQYDLLHNYLNDSLNATTGHVHTGGTSDAPKLTLTAGASVTGTLPTTLGGTALTSYTQGDIIYSSAANTLAKLAAGTSGQFLKTLGAGANPLWATIVSSILDYGTSASSSTAKSIADLKIAYGKIDIAAVSSQAITNLPFTSNSTYQVVTGYSVGVPESPDVTYNSGAQFTLTNNNGGGTKTILWIAVGT